MNFYVLHQNQIFTKLILIILTTQGHFPNSVLSQPYFPTFPEEKKSNLKIAFTWCMQKHAKIYISKIESWPNNIWWNSINFRLTELGPMWNEGWLTTQRSHRLVSLAVRRVTFAGAMSGGACRVWIFLDGWLGGLVPTMFTWRIRNLQQRKPDNCG